MPDESLFYVNEPAGVQEASSEYDRPVYFAEFVLRAGSKVFPVAATPRPRPASTARIAGVLGPFVNHEYGSKAMARHKNRNTNRRLGIETAGPIISIIQSVR